MAASLADQARGLSGDELAAWVAELSQDEAQALLYDWTFWARPEQLPPAGLWVVWLIQAGRGFGKTRTGAEWCRGEVTAGHRGRLALVARTAADARDVMVEGESGLLAISPPWFRPKYEPSKRRLTWPNGAIATLYSADEPDLLRGPQHDGFWADEVAAWRFVDAWDQLMFGLRLGQDPRGVVTTTPRPTKLIKDLASAPTTVVTRGATKDNASNLAQSFLAKIVEKYQGTRLGRQELDGEILDDNPGALWKRANIDASRITREDRPDLTRVVVGVDPAVTSNADSDETGIVSAGRDNQIPPHFYVLLDSSLQASPDTWARAVVKAYDDQEADRVVAEVNNGGDMVEAVIRAVDSGVSYKAVHATRGKTIRAEPIAALYEQGRVHHVGSFPQLEDQMCVVGGTMVETTSGQVPIEDIRVGDLVITSQGPAPVRWAGKTGETNNLLTVVYSHGCVILTPWHPIFNPSLSMFVPARSVQVGSYLSVSPRWAGTAPQSHGADVGTARCEADTSGTPEARCSTGQFGRPILARFQPGCWFTTLTRTQAITFWRIWSWLRRSSTQPLTIPKASLFGIQNADPSVASAGGPTVCPANLSALSAEANTKPSACVPFTALVNAIERPSGSRSKRAVYNLTVEDGYPHEFYANGILVHNCDWDPLAGMDSPDRMDALVWALTELSAETAGEGLLGYIRELKREQEQA